MSEIQNIGNSSGVDRLSSQADENISNQVKLQGKEEAETISSDSLDAFERAYAGLNASYQTLAPSDQYAIADLMLELNDIVNSLQSAVTTRLNTSSTVIQNIQSQRSMVRVYADGDINGMPGDANQRMNKYSAINSLAGAGATALDAQLDKAQTIAKNLEARLSRFKDFNSQDLDNFKQYLQILQALGSKINTMRA